MITDMQVTFEAGQTETNVSVRTMIDRLDEGVESFTVTLSDPSDGASLGLNFVATVCISDRKV